MLSSAKSGWVPLNFHANVRATSQHTVLRNVRAHIRKYVVSWLKHSRESNRPLLGPKGFVLYQQTESPAERKRCAIWLLYTLGYKTLKKVLFMTCYGCLAILLRRTIRQSRAEFQEQSRDLTTSVGVDPNAL